MSVFRSILGMSVVLALATGCGMLKSAPPPGQLVVPLDIAKPPQSAVSVSLSDYSVTSSFTNVVNIVRLPDGRFLALSAKDPNMGCTVTWNNQSQTFRNPCHGAQYDIRGEVVSGPAVRGLDRFPLRVDHEKKTIVINVSVPPDPGADPGE